MKIWDLSAASGGRAFHAFKEDAKVMKWLMVGWWLVVEGEK